MSSLSSHSHTHQEVDHWDDGLVMETQSQRAMAGNEHQGAFWSMVLTSKFLQ